MTRKSGLIVTGVIVGLLGVLLAAPGLVNWDDRKPEISERIEATMGRKLSLDGPLSLSLLPSPHLSAKDVRLANVEGAASPDMAKLASLQLRLRLWPLLRGRFAISSLVLQSPEIHLERLADGRTNWDFHKPGAAPAPSATAAPSEAPSKPHAATPLRIDKVVVKDGIITYQAPQGEPIRVEGLDAQFSASTPEGPFHAQGSARARGMGLSVEGSLARLDGAAAPASLVLRMAGGELRLDGSVAADRSFDGKLAFGWGKVKAAGETKLHLTERGQIEASVDLAVDPVSLAAGTIKQGRLNLALANGEVTVNQASVVLPGETEINLFGFVAFDHGSPAFDGTLDATAHDPHALAAWLGWGDVPGDEIRLGGALKLKRQAIRLDNGELLLAGQTVRGLTLDGGWADGVLTLNDLSAGDVAGAQVKISGAVAGLAGGQPSLRDLKYDLRTKHAQKLADLAGWQPPFDLGRLGPLALSGSVDGTREIIKLDSRIEAAGGLLKLSGLVGHPLSGHPKPDMTVEASHQSLAQLVHLFAPDYHPSGTLGGFAGSTRLFADGAGTQFSDLRLKLGPASLAGEAHLSQDPRPRLDLALNGGEWPVEPFLPGKRPSALRQMIDGGFLIPSKGDLPERRGVPAIGPEPPLTKAAPRPYVHSIALADHASSEPLELGWMRRFDANIKLDAQALTWGRTRLDNPTLSLALAQGVATLDSFSAQVYGGKLDLAGKLDAQGQASLQSSLAGAQMHDALLGLADIDLAQGVMDAQASLTSSGQSSAEMLGRLNGSAKMLIKDGTIKGFDLKAVDGQLKSVNNPMGLINLLQAGLSGGSTKFTSLAGTFRAANGVVTTDDLTLTADGGGAKATGEVNLPGSVMDAKVEFRLASAPTAPPLVMRLSGPPDHPKKVLDVNAIQTWLIERGGGAEKLRAKAKDFLKKFLQNQ